VARISVVDADALADTSAERLTALIESAIEERDVASVALTGGTTPRATYEALADRSRPWRHRLA
jgi:6-phosphogluconolactonase